MTNPIILSAAKYLTRHIQSTGRFDYEYNPVTDEVSKDYNHIRHAGTLYALYQVADNLKQIELANDYAGKYLNETNLIETGYVALLLCAQIERNKTGWLKKVPAEVLGDLLLKFQTDEGGFIHHFKVATKERVTKPVMYFEGQAILALSRLYQVTKDEKYLQAAIKAADYICNRDIEKPLQEIGKDHWNAIAFAQLFSINASTVYRNYAEKVAEGILASPTVKLIGHQSAKEKHRLGEVATRIEGLAAVAQMPGYSVIKTPIEEAIKLLLLFISNLQYTAANTTHLKNPQAAIGGFYNSHTDPTIRIDGVQHAISAIIESQKVFRRA